MYDIGIRLFICGIVGLVAIAIATILDLLIWGGIPYHWRKTVLTAFIITTLLCIVGASFIIISGGSVWELFREVFV